MLAIFLAFHFASQLAENQKNKKTLYFKVFLLSLFLNCLSILYYLCNFQTSKQ